MSAERKEIPFCPLLSAGSEIDKVCTQERCAWYMTATKKCAVYILGYNSLIDANSKQILKKRI